MNVDQVLEAIDLIDDVYGAAAVPSESLTIEDIRSAIQRGFVKEVGVGEVLNADGSCNPRPRYAKGYMLTDKGKRHLEPSRA